MSLSNLANRFSSLGRREEALEMAQAVDLRRQLGVKTTPTPQAFTPDLATSLNNLGSFLSGLGRRDEALGIAEEALGLRRELAMANPQAFTTDLAESLSNLANFLSGLGRPEKALRVAQEAVDLRRQLAAANPQAFTPDLAMSLGTLCFQDVPLLTEDPVLLAERCQLLPLGGAEPVATAGVDLGLPDPLPHRGLGEVHLPGDRGHRLAAAADEPDHLRLELLGKRPPWSPLPVGSSGHQDILSGVRPHTLGVRQTGSTPRLRELGIDAQLS
jgi:tetratricopeptide (TPR) repeat protein